MKISKLPKNITTLYKWYHTNKGKPKYHAGIVLIIILVMGCWHFSGLDSTKKEVTNLPEIVVQKVATKTLPLEIKVPSSIIANAEVLIRARIDGQIKSVHFKEGQYVNEGDLLFKIDDDLLKTQLAQAKANLEKNQAQLEQTKKTLTRNQALLKKQIVTKAAIDQYDAEVKKAQGSLDADQALVKSLELQISYAQVKSPINGIAGFIKAEPGSFVRQASDTNLVSIVAIDPIEAIFAIPEKYLTTVLEKGIEKLIVKIFDVNSKEIPNQIKPSALDQGVDAKSGVFSLKVAITNKDRQLRPGMSVTGRIKLDNFANATTIPTEALLSAQDGSYVFVYDAQTKKVKRQPVKVRDTVDNDVIIESGLKPDQTVVTEGQIRLKDNLEVKVMQ